MKVKFTFLVCFFFFVICTNLKAQIDAGSKFTAVEGALKLNFNAYYTAFDGNLFLQKGKFLAPNFLLGGDLGLSYTAGDYDETFKGSIGVFDRLYFSTKSNVCPYFETAIDLGGAGGYDQGFLFRVKGGPGISFRVGENVLLDTKLRYVLEKISDTDPLHGIQFTIGVGIVKSPQ